MKAEAISGTGGAASGPRSISRTLQHIHTSAASPSTQSPNASPTVSENHQRSSSDAAVGPARRFAEHDSFVSVRLSQPPRQLTLNTNLSNLAARRSLLAATLYPVSSPASPQRLSSPSVDPDEFLSPVTSIPSGAIRPKLQEELEGFNDDAKTIGPVEDEDSDDEEANWEQLRKTEDAECNEGIGDDTTAMLLARLERENDKIATNPKSVKVHAVEEIRQQAAAERQPRSPPMAQLRHMVHALHPGQLRYSQLPPPPMTDLEFYAALVKDYKQTAACLPTLLTNKIRKGIPPPLRGVVWQSMSGARDGHLEDQFDRFTGETSPYEGLIGKDLGRSFPGVEMFRDPEGDGQRMLGRVLKCYSLYDPKIGYCQGLALLVGPLLMHVCREQSFPHSAICKDFMQDSDIPTDVRKTGVLRFDESSRLMNQYDMRASFLPDLYGLHVKIYQHRMAGLLTHSAKRIRELLREHLPALSAHLDHLQVDLACVSQWLLSLFAVTCPLPMLFRMSFKSLLLSARRLGPGFRSVNNRFLGIYDVIFAEGASETIMRVTLSLLRKNQGRILACREMEEVLQLLLSRSLWSCYRRGCPAEDADEFVLDFVSLSQVVSRERLVALEQRYQEGQLANQQALPSANAARSSELTSATSRLLGCLWANSTTTSLKAFPNNYHSSSSISSNAASRPMSMLQRSASKQSLASTLNSMEASSTSISSASSVLSTVPTEATSNFSDSTTNDSSTLGRDSATKLATQGQNLDCRNLHSQIEDLLTVLSDLQRQHSLLADQLQREREERDEDEKAVRFLLEGIKKNTQIVAAISANCCDDATTSNGTLMDVIDHMQTRFCGDKNKRTSSITETKHQMRDDLACANEQLQLEVTRTQDAIRRVVDMEAELSSMKEQLRESHAHVRTLHTEKQRLERQAQAMRARGSDSAGNEGGGGWLNRNQSKLSNASLTGLRELKLGRSQSTPSQITTNKRTSSMIPPPDLPAMAPTLAVQPSMSPSEHEAILVELAQAKTAEAIAKQEAEEIKQRFEQLRKSLGLPNDQLLASPSPGHPQVQGGIGGLSGPGGIGGMFRNFTSPASDIAAAGPRFNASVTPAPVPTPAPASSGGGFWGWKRLP